MHSHDIDAIRVVIDRNPSLNPHTIVCPSGEGAEVELCRSVWGVEPRCVPRSEWDLDDAPPSYLRGHDLALVCNTFLCSRDQARWLANLAGAADTLLVQDLCRGRRGHSGRVTDPGSGDLVRYSVTSHGLVGITDEDSSYPVFDLSSCGATVLDAFGYQHDGAGPRNLVAVLDLRPLRRTARPWFGSLVGILPWEGVMWEGAEGLAMLAMMA